MKKNFYSPKFSTAFLLLIFAAFTPAFHAQSADTRSVNKNWIGTYEFFDSEKGNPRNQPGNFITYILTVSLNGDALSARFSADGAQTSDEYECSVQAAGDSIKVFFEKDLNGMNESRFKPFKKGELLFTVAKMRPGKTSKYLYGAGGYEILPLSAASKKIYFLRKSK